MPLDEDGAAVNWRTLIVLEEGAEAEVWEHYSSAGDDDRRAAQLGRRAARSARRRRLRYVSTQDISESAWIFATQRAEVERDASLDWTALGFGSARGKVRMETKLAGAGRGGAGDRRLRRRPEPAPRLRHHAGARGAEHRPPTSPSAASSPTGATAVWRGMIKVDPGAQQTDAFQESRNLLLSTEAHADAIPGLEIEANDVRCTHAAAVAQIDREQLFYLTSRGLDDDVAKGLIIEGFLESLVERLAEGPVREQVADGARASPGRDPLVLLLLALLATLEEHRPADREDDDQHRRYVEGPQVVAGVSDRKRIGHWTSSVAMPMLEPETTTGNCPGREARNEITAADSTVSAIP